MTNTMWHLYYSGVDVVDANEEWRQLHLNNEICSKCGNYSPRKSPSVELIVEQKIPKNSDMFTTGYLAPSIMSTRMREVLPEQVEDVIDFGSIFFSNHSKKIETHVAYVGKFPWVLLFGDQPDFIDGQPVTDPHIFTCEGCGIRHGYGRGKKYIDTKVSLVHDISWSDFGGILISDQIMQLFTGIKLKNVRIEKIEIR